MIRLFYFLVLCVFVAEANARVEPWYLNGGIGAANISYHDRIQSRIDGFINEDVGFDRMMPAEFNLGVYFPLNGVISTHGMAYRITANTPLYMRRVRDVEITIIQQEMSYSAYKFLSGLVGRGWFFRGDISMGMRSSTFKDNRINNTERFKEYGMGFLIGGGYGVNLSQETRGLIELRYSSLGNVTDREHAFTFLLGVMW